MTGEKEIIQELVNYEGSRVVVTVDNSKLLITHVRSVILCPEDNRKELKLKNVYHAPGMKKNLLSVSQLTSTGHYVLFGPDDVKVFTQFQTHSKPVAQGRRLESIYVMSAETALTKQRRTRMLISGICG